MLPTRTLWQDLIASLNASEAVIGRFVSRWSPEATSFMIGAEEVCLAGSGVHELVAAGL